MIVQSLGRQTDLIFSRFSGSVEDKGHYILIQTPNNPGYHWGNFIIFDRPPEKGDYKKWKQLFDKEFSYYKEPHHYVFTWNKKQGFKGEVQDFIDNGFEFDTEVILTAKTLNPPPYQNDEIIVRKIRTDEEWQRVTNLQILCADPKFFNEYYKDFKKKQMKNYRKMVEAKKGYWFGAFQENNLVGDLGIFYEGNVARYQNVETHPKYRKKGICGTLVYKSGEIALREYGVDQLVMEADFNYHAARIYESVGFRRSEINYSLNWWKGGDG